MINSKIRNILLLTSIYPASDIGKEHTPVVHYFAKEWVKLGYNVIVMHYPSNFPKVMLWMASLFKKQISSKSGAIIRTYQLEEAEYELDGVKVKRLPLLKCKPHGRFKKKQIRKVYKRTVEYCTCIDYRPDIVISHWANPQLEIMRGLKVLYNVPSCYIAHLKGHDLLAIYSKEKAKELIANIDIIGFRSDYIKRQFISIFDYCGPSFQCYSGIPQQYIYQLETRNFNNVNSFIFVGTMIERKYPALVVKAVYGAFGGEDFSMCYIGRGGETKNILKYANEFNIKNKVHLLGFLAREQVIEQLKNHDVFVMISCNETFGLVYLEAMAVGCITIAARNEGFDGIIKDGINGFLCEAGNVDELTEIIKKIKKMSPETLQNISVKAIETARELTEEKAARKYLEAIEQIY